MLHAVTTILTAATTLAHALLGCCWHHGHARDAAHVEDVAAVATCCGCGKHSPQDVFGAQAGESNSDEAECCGATCTALKPVPKDERLLRPQIFAGAIADHLEAVVVSASVSGSHPPDRRAASTSALPLRAEISVWLL